MLFIISSNFHYQGRRHQDDPQTSNTKFLTQSPKPSLKTFVISDSSKTILRNGVLRIALKFYPKFRIFESADKRERPQRSRQ